MYLTPRNPFFIGPGFTDIVISLRYSFCGGWRNVKLLYSDECSRGRDYCIFCVNDCEVFL